MRLLSFFFIAAMVFSAVTVHAQTTSGVLTQTEGEACAQNSLFVGASQKVISSTCYPDIVSLHNNVKGIPCDFAANNGCCRNAAADKAFCVPLGIKNSSASPDATAVPQAANCGKGLESDPKDPSNCIPIPIKPITFTPNVDIPGLFVGSQTVDSTLFARYLGAFYVYFIGVVGILAVVMIMWGGYHYIVAAGNSSKMNQGKEIITNSVIGLVLALTSFLLLSLINPRLVSFQGIIPKVIVAILQPEESLIEPMKGGSLVQESDFSAIAARVKKEPTWVNEVKAQAAVIGVPPERLMAILFIESSGVPTKISDKGACGLMQILPATAGYQTCTQLFDPIVNIRSGAKFYGQLFRNTCPQETSKHKCSSGNPCRTGDYKYVNAAYNTGLGINYCSQSCKLQTIWECIKNGRSETIREYVIKAQNAYDYLVSSNFFSS